MIVKAGQLASTEQEFNRSNVAQKTQPVLHLINGEHFAGAERVQDLLANCLPHFGYQADFVCMKLGKFAEVRTSQSKLYQLNMRHSFDVLIARKVCQYVKENEYKILHAHTPRSILIGSLAASWTNLPLVYHVHSPVGRDSTRKLRNRVNTWVESRCLKNVSSMICVSQSLKEYMAELGHSESKLHVVRNGVPTIENAAPVPPKETWTIGTMALFRPRKGVECLLQALAKMKSKGYNVHLRAVGGFESKEYEQEVMNLVSHLGISDSITWTGFVTDINAEFREMDLFVLPSLFGEGLPMVVLEAMANGVPVLASRVEGIPEAIRDGVDGLIFDAGSDDDLVEKFSQVYGDIGFWQRMSQNSYQRQQKELSDMSMAQGVAKVYDQICQ